MIIVKNVLREVPYAVIVTLWPTILIETHSVINETGSGQRF